MWIRKEKFFPTNVEVMLENSTLWEFDTEESTKIPQYDKTAEFISDYTTPDCYLDLDDEGSVLISKLYLFCYRKTI